MLLIKWPCGGQRSTGQQCRGVNARNASSFGLLSNLIMKGSIVVQTVQWKQLERFM